MDRVARENIAAASAVRQELGSAYDDVIAEGLIDRIGAEIDKRIDARLEGRRQTRRTDIGELERRRNLWKGATVGAAAIGLPAIMVSLASQYNSKGVIPIVILIWVVIAAGYGIARWLHTQRQQDE